MHSGGARIGAVFWVSLAVALAFIVWDVLFTDNFSAVTQACFDWVVSNLGWSYLLVGSFFLGFVAFLAFSRYGKLQVGKEGDRPEFSRFAWFAMRSRPG
jgi:glycine betaine transporter